MKKKQLSNIIMVTIIVLIAAAGILTAGYVQGWFDHSTDQAVLTDIKGIINLQRDGVAFRAETDTPLRQGDLLSCDPGATATVRLDENTWLVVGEKAQLAVDVPQIDGFAANVTAGEIMAFSNAPEGGTARPVTLRFAEKEVKVENAAVGLSVLQGSENLSVYAGTAMEAKQGQMLSWVKGEQSVEILDIDMLNSFAIDGLRRVNAQRVSCFDNEALDALVQERRTQMQKPEQTEPAETRQTETATEPEQTEAPDTAESGTQSKPDSKPQESKPSDQKPDSKPEQTEPPATEAPATEPPATEPPATEPKLTATLSIRCDTILNNMENLDPAKVGYVPSDGWILYTEVEFTEGETVFDVLKRACSTYGIQLEYSYSPTYGSNYIEGINNLYEFDCGAQSGWMYKVNGWFPNYGVSAYTLSGGENITFCYTCDLGADVGGHV